MLGRKASGDRTPFPPGFGTIWTTVALDLIGFGIVLPILPLYAERFGASATTIGVLLASFSIAQLLLAPVWGRLSDRVGRKPVILISLFGTAAGSFLTGAAGSLPLLFLGRLVDGASGAVRAALWHAGRATRRASRSRKRRSPMSPNRPTGHDCSACCPPRSASASSPDRPSARSPRSAGHTCPSISPDASRS